jgi:hypothetical protein
MTTPPQQEKKEKKFAITPREHFWQEKILQFYHVLAAHWFIPSNLCKSGVDYTWILLDTTNPGGKGGGGGGGPIFLKGIFFAKVAFVEMAFVGPLKQK